MSTPLTMAVSKEVIDMIDPDGGMRREGRLDLSRVPVVEAADKWTPKTKDTFYRVWNGKLWRKQCAEWFFGGSQIHYVSLSNTRLVKEWLT